MDCREGSFGLLLRPVLNGGLVRQNGGPFRVRPWHYERCRGYLLSRFVCRSTAIYPLILPLYISRQLHGNFRPLIRYFSHLTEYLTTVHGDPADVEQASQLLGCCAS